MPLPAASRTTSLLKDAFGAMAVRMLGIGLLFASTTLAARLLGSEEYGAFSAAFSLAILLATLAPLGSDRIMLRNLSTCESADPAGREVSHTHLITAVMAVVLYMISMALVISGPELGMSDGWQVTVFLSALMFFPVAVTYLRQWAAIPLLGTRVALIPEQTILPIAFMIVLSLLYQGGNSLTAFTATVVYSAVMLVIWFWSMQHRTIAPMYRTAMRHRITLREMSARVSEGLPFTTTALGTAMLQRSMPLVIVATCGFTAAAQFSIAHSFANLAGIPLSILNLCVLPRCTSLVSNSRLREAGHLVSATAGLSMALSSVIGAVTIVLLPLAIQLLGKSYAEIATILWLLILSAIVDAVPGPSVSLLQSMHLERVWSWIVTLFVPVQLLTVWLASSWGGLTGAAGGYLITRAIWNLLLVGTVYRLRGVLILPKFSWSWLAESLRAPPGPTEPLRTVPGPPGRNEEESQAGAHLASSGSAAHVSLPAA